jgi:hypothetical protein
VEDTAVRVAAGLCSAEAARRLAADGPNAVAAPPRHGVAGRIGRQLRDPLVALLLAAAVVTALLGDLPDTAVIADHRQHGDRRGPGGTGGAALFLVNRMAAPAASRRMARSTRRAP